MAIDSFVLYTNYMEQLEMLTFEQRGLILTSIFAYAAGGSLPDMDAATKMAFSFISAQMDRDAAKWAATREKRQAAARQRWDKEQDLIDAKDANAYGAYDCNASDATDAVDVNGNVDVNVNGIDKPSTKASSRFIQPTLEEVTAYCLERKNSVNPQKFIDFYVSNGWKVGKNPMKDWKAAIRGRWENGEERGQAPAIVPAPARKLFRADNIFKEDKA